MTLLIKNAVLLGTKKIFTKRADVFISGEKIAAIGQFQNKSADIIIDAEGAYLAPGFIDLSTHFDHYLDILKNPGGEEFLRAGVTTLIGGSHGASLAPLPYGEIDLFERWASARGSNINWHSMKEFVATIKNISLGVNFGTFIGYETVRNAILGDPFRTPTMKEYAVIQHALSQALSDGGLGISFHRTARASKISNEEIKKILDSFGHSLTYVPHINATENEKYFEFLDESARFAERYNDLKVVVDFSLPLDSDTTEINLLQKKLEKYSSLENFYFTLSPHAEFMPLQAFIPETISEEVKILIKKFSDPLVRKKLISNLPSLDLYSTVVAEAPHNDNLVQKTLEELGGIFDLSDPRGILMRLMLLSHFQGALWVPRHRNEMFNMILAYPRTMIVSRAGTFGPYHSASYHHREDPGAFMNCLAHLQEQGVISLDEGIKRMSALPALVLGAKERGVIHEGMYADLVMFKNFEIIDSFLKGVSLQGGSKAMRRVGDVIRGNGQNSGRLLNKINYFPFRSVLKKLKYVSFKKN